MKTGSLPIYFTKLSVLLLAILITSGCSKKNESTAGSATSSVEAPVETTAEKTSEPDSVVFEMDLNGIQLNEKPPVEQEFTQAPSNPEY